MTDAKVGRSGISARDFGAANRADSAGVRCDLRRIREPRATLLTTTARARPWGVAAVCFSHYIGWIGSHHTHRGRLNRSMFLGAAGAHVGFGDAFLGERLAATGIQTSAPSSRFEFMATLGVRWGHPAVMARHASNGVSSATAPQPWGNHAADRRRVLNPARRMTGSYHGCAALAACFAVLA